MIKGYVLVLNRNYIAIQITNVQHAVKHLYTGNAKIVAHSDIKNSRNNIVVHKYETFDWGGWIKVSQEIEEDPKKFIHSVRFKMRVPSIIVLVTFDRLPERQIKFSRQNIYARDGYKCQYCETHRNKTRLTIDHVIPKSKGGKTTWDNIVSCCYDCNQKKRDRTPREAGMKLSKIPRKPRWLPVETKEKFSRINKGEWKDFLTVCEL